MRMPYIYSSIPTKGGEIMNETENVVIATTEEEKPVVARKSKKFLLSSVMAAVMVMAMAVASFADDGTGGASLTGGVATVVSVVGEVVSLITGNSILMAMLGAGLLSVAIGVFARLFHSLRG